MSKTPAQRQRENEEAYRRLLKRKFHNSPQALANALGLSRQLVGMWKTVHIKYARRVSEIAKVPLEEVLPHPIP